MITGRYPHSTGAEQLHWPLPREQVTFVELLKQAGLSRDGSELLNFFRKRAVGQPPDYAKLLGQLDESFYADLIAIDETTGGDVFDKIVADQGPTPWMMLGGEIVTF